MTLQQSSRRSPCPICRRDTDGDCRFGADLILCHQGTRFAPPPNLRPGDVVTVDGAPWALIRTGAGYDGAAFEFRPHRPRVDHRVGHFRRARRYRQRSPQLLAWNALLQFLSAFREAMLCPEFTQCTLAELRHYFRVIDSAMDAGNQLLPRLSALSATDQKWRRYALSVRLKLKTLAYQQADARSFRRNHLGESLITWGQDNVN